MTVTVYDTLEQGSPEWLQARCGVLTASEIGKLLTSTLKVADNETSRALVYRIAAERITGEPEYMHPTFDMMRGTEDEPIARAAYVEHYAEVHEVGFIVRKEEDYTLGFSPDGLVGKHGFIEIKSRKPAIHMRTVLTDTVPAENMAQIMAGLLVSGRKWADYISYTPSHPLYVKRVHPDPAWFHALKEAARIFETRVTETITTYTTRTTGLPVMAPRVDFEEIRI